MSSKTEKTKEEIKEEIAFIEEHPEFINNALKYYRNRIEEQDDEIWLKNIDLNLRDSVIDSKDELIRTGNELIDYQRKIIDSQDEIIRTGNELIRTGEKRIELLESIISEYDLLSEGEYSVYIHILPNKSIYIGQTRQSLKERWQNGRGYEHNNFFSNLIKKYGWNNIDHLLYKDNLTKFEADTIEKDLIKFYSENELITGRVVLNIRYNGD